MSKNYKILKQSKMTVDFLHTNATTHAFILGALAEIVDNSRDAEANYIKIFAVDRSDLRGGYILCFLDDGYGMDPDECYRTTLLGYTENVTVMNKIGRYGNGLKSSTLRIANDFMLFTKKNNILSISFLSRTFYNEEAINKTDLYVAVPSFHADNRSKPWFDVNEDDENTARERHELELSLIFKFSPFKTLSQLFEQFDKIDGVSGTLVIIFNLLLGDNGKPYLTVDREKKDIIVKNDEDEDDDKLGFIPEERKSLRKYLSIIYTNPKMKIYIENSKVHTRILEQSLYLTRSYKFVTKNFKNKAEKDVAVAESVVKTIERKLEEAKSNVRDLKTRLTSLTKEESRIFQKKNNLIAVIQSELNEKKKTLEMLKKISKEEKHLIFKFGININNRAQSGCFIYNQHRLILMYKKVGRQLKHDPDYNGIVGIVDVPYSIMAPQHTKQKFEDDGEYNKLKKSLADYMDQYIKDIRIELNKDHLREFWQEFGYLYEDSDIPSDETRYVRKRFFRIPTLVQCDSCLKWRTWPPVQADMTTSFSDNWRCENLPGYSCLTPEKLPEPTKGELKRDVKIIIKEQPETPARPIVQPRLSVSENRPRINPLEIAKQNSIRTQELKKPLSSQNQTSSQKFIPSSNSNSSMSSNNSRVNDFVNKVIDDVERDDNLRTNRKRSSSDCFENVFDNENDGGSDNDNGIINKRLNSLNNKKRRGSKMAGLNSDSEDTDYVPSRSTSDMYKKKANTVNKNKQEMEIVTEIDLPPVKNKLFVKPEPELSKSKNGSSNIEEEIKKHLECDYNEFVLDDGDYRHAFDTLADKLRSLLNSICPNHNFDKYPKEFFLVFDVEKFAREKISETFDKELRNKMRDFINKSNNKK